MLKKLLCGAATAIILSGCGAHSTDSVTSAEFSNTNTNKTISRLPDLEDVYAQAIRQNTTPAGLKEVDVRYLAADEKLIVQLLPNFDKEIQLCKANTCERVTPVRSIDAGTKVAGGDEVLPGEDEVIAEVLPNSETLKKYGMPLPKGGNKKNIIVMPPDIELSELGVSGILTPNALWTDIATKYVTELTAQYFQKVGLGVTFAKKDALGIAASEIDSLKKLNSQVGLSVMMFQQNPLLKLPTLDGKPLDWPLGAGTKQFSEKYGADYGLFVYLRDSYTSGSRAAASIISSVLFGVSLQGGHQVGFATMVDLETGKLVWFNSLFSARADLRTYKAAIETTNALYQELPL